VLPCIAYAGGTDAKARAAHVRRFQDDPNCAVRTPQLCVRTACVVPPARPPPRVCVTPHGRQCTRVVPCSHLHRWLCCPSQLRALASHSRRPRWLSLRVRAVSAAATNVCAAMWNRVLCDFRPPGPMWLSQCWAW
jgi:hypothetical protein